MDYECIKVNSKRDRKEFLNLPGRLYPRFKRPTGRALERKILTNSHVLSGDFQAMGFLVKAGGRTLARCLLAVYENDTNGYVGFFESVYDPAAAAHLFQTVEAEAKKLHLKKLVGPVNASFWIGYRMKTDHFEKHYTCQPYNREYYKELWEIFGFEAVEHYYSSQLRVPKPNDANPKFQARLQQMLNSGCSIQTADKKTFDADLENIYHLLLKLYAKFPMYKPIKKDAFLSMFRPMRRILDYHIVFLAYKEEKLAGFMVCLPNFYNGGLLKNLLGMHKEYVMLYLGADSSCPGLGGAFAELCRSYLVKTQSACIPALIHSGNVSGSFYKELSTAVYHYVLMEKELTHVL